jgi:molybdenum cofactor biosynthesis protein MoaC
MLDVTPRPPTLRRATAEARVTMRPESITTIREGRVPKGDVGEVTRGVALLALKQTPDLLPFCHRILVEHGQVEVVVEETSVRIRVEVAAIARTGVEVEAMVGATVAALNVYDMVKPIDANAAIESARVVSKTGGWGSFRADLERPVRAGVLVVSDSVAAGTKHDRAGKAVQRALLAEDVELAARDTVPDEPDRIAEIVRRWTDKDALDLVLAVGGTGLGPRDRTPEAFAGLIERELPGLGEAIRAHGRERTPYADLSRAIAGQRGQALIVALPGSTGGASESMEALLPWVLHVVRVFEKGYRHGE